MGLRQAVETEKEMTAVADNEKRLTVRTIGRGPMGQLRVQGIITSRGPCLDILTPQYRGIRLGPKMIRTLLGYIEASLQEIAAEVDSGKTRR